MRSSLELEGRFLLEGFDEFHEVAFVCGGGSQRVQMVRHDTVGMDKKEASSSVFLEARNQPTSDARISAEAATAVEAQSNKIGGPTEIIARRKTNVLAFQRGRDGHERKDAALKAAALHLNLTSRGLRALILIAAYDTVSNWEPQSTKARCRAEDPGATFKP